MNKLPGLGALRLLPLQAAQRALAKTLKTQCADLGAKSNLLNTYRSKRSRLMRKMSVPMLRRRSNFSFLEKRPIEGTSTVTKQGCARLPVAMRHNPKTLATKKQLGPSQWPLIMPSSNVWAGLVAHRSFATMVNARAEKQRLRAINERPMVPQLEFVEETPKPKKASKHETIVREPDAKSHGSLKERPLVPTLDFSDQPEPLVVGSRKAGNPSIGDHTAIRTRHETEPLAKRQLNAKLSHHALKRSSNLQYLMSKYPLMHQLQSPVLDYLRATNATPETLDTFETRLRALRTAQPLNLRLPSLAESDSLSVSHRRHWMPRFANVGGSKRFEPAQTQKTAPSQMLPGIKAHKKSIQSKKPPQQQKKSQKIPKPPVKARESSVRPEREDLDHLLGDLLDKHAAPVAQNVSIEFNKTAPLFKLVTGSLEGRHKLYNRTFDKQLASPQLYRHPATRNLNGSPRIQRPAGFLGQSAVFRAKTLLENKLSLLLNANEEDEDNESDDGH